MDLNSRPVVNNVFSLQNCFARNFYNMRLLALFLTFAINFILLFYKASIDFPAKTSALMLLDSLACFYVFRQLK